MNFNRVFLLCGIAAALTLGSHALMAQENPPPPKRPDGDRGGDRGRGRFDPADMQKRMMEGIRERLGFKEEAEWAAVQPLVQKVMELRLTSALGGIRFGRPPGGGGSSGERSPDSSRSPWSNPNPEAEALQKAIDDNAPAAQVKAALDKFRASRKEKEAQLTAAQEDLRKVLTARQEAQATLIGLLP